MLRALFGKKWSAALAIIASLAVTELVPAAETTQDERFKNVEIRVIRPRFFNKAKRFELGAALASIMNETFIYTYLVSGVITYHFTEYVAAEVTGSYGINLDKEDKRVLFDEFEIKTKIFRSAYAGEFALQLTPLYGKWQLPAGRVVYFDTFVAAGGGITGIQWKYSDFCTDPDLAKNAKATPIPADATKPYPTVMFALGQRYFMTKDVSYKWDIRTHGIIYDRLDAECDPVNADVVRSGPPHYNITLQLGASKYF